MSPRADPPLPSAAPPAAPGSSEPGIRAQKAEAAAPRRAPQWLDQAIWLLLLLLAFAAPVWTKAAVLLFRLALVLWAVKLVWAGRSRRLDPLPITAPLLAYVTLAFISTLFSPEPMLSWGRMRTILLFMIAPLVACNVSTRRQMRALVAALIASTLVGVGYSGWQYLEGIRGQRVQGFFYSYIPYAEILMLMAALCFGMLAAAAKSRKAWPAAGFLAAFATIFGALLATETRAAVGAVLVVCTLALLLVGSMKIRVFSVAALLVALVAGSFWFQRERKGEGWIDLRDPGTQYRLLMWQDGVRLALAHPLTGIGMDTVESRGQELGIRAYAKYPNLKSHFHSTYIQIATECGLPALGAWLWLMAALLWASWRRWRERLNSPWFENGRALGITAALLAFCAISLSHYIWGDAEVMVVFWLVAGFALAPR